MIIDFRYTMCYKKWLEKNVVYSALKHINDKNYFRPTYQYHINMLLLPIIFRLKNILQNI